MMTEERPHLRVPIVDCGEPLVAIPGDRFAFVSPHPYQALGADYRGGSPYCLRSGVLAALEQAQRLLQQRQPGWGLLIFDAYRPLAVQRFMVDYTFVQLAAAHPPTTAAEEGALWAQVEQFWAPPSGDPGMPPPHSTGAAVDLTLRDAQGQAVDLGGEIDEISPRSHPDFYAQAGDRRGQLYHHHRQCLNEVMGEAGFVRHPGEWWHFSLGDQRWAWLTQQPIARYGAIGDHGNLSP